MGLSIYKVKEIGRVIKATPNIIELGKPDNAVIFDKETLKEELKTNKELNKDEKEVVKEIIQELEEAKEQDSTFLYWY